MSRHLVEWLLRNPIDLPPVENVGADRAWRVLIGLADHAHENTGAMWASDRTQERETGLERRGIIQPVRQALEVAGWLVDTGKRGARGVRVYELVIPGYSRPVASGEGDHAQTELNKTPPLPPKPEHRSERQETPGGGIENEVMTGVLEREGRTVQNPGAGIKRNWRTEYAPIIRQAVQAHPDWRIPALVDHCFNLRNDLAPSPTSHADNYAGGAPDCPHCHGAGYGLVRDNQGIATTRKCVCVGGTWEGATDLADLAPSQPSPTSHADIDPVKELRRQLRRVV